MVSLQLLPKSLDLLWLEILFNDHISREDYLDVPEIKLAYDKACVWYSNFKTMIDSTVTRRPFCLDPSGYREKVIEIYGDEFLTVNVLDPLDFIIAKLRRFTEEDIEAALFVARRYNIKIEEIEKRAEEAIRNSPKDTTLFVFRKNVGIFISKLQP